MKHLIIGAGPAGVIAAETLRTQDPEADIVLIGDEPDFKGFYIEECNAPRFVCSCSKDKMGAVIRTLPISERMEIVKKNQPISIQCQFCNARYELSIAECIAAWNSPKENDQQ